MNERKNNSALGRLWLPQLSTTEEFRVDGSRKLARVALTVHDRRKREILNVFAKNGRLTGPYETKKL